MNRLEVAALRHAADWLRYSRSPQAKRDMAIEAVNMAKADKANGHTPQCGLMKCSPNCPSIRRK